MLSPGFEAYLTFHLERLGVLQSVEEQENSTLCVRWVGWFCGDERNEAEELLCHRVLCGSSWALLRRFLVCRLWVLYYTDPFPLPTH